jgi:hypothetical protein
MGTTLRRIIGVIGSTLVFVATIGASEAQAHGREATNILRDPSGDNVDTYALGQYTGEQQDPPTMTLEETVDVTN